MSERRNLPSWMSSKSSGDKPASDSNENKKNEHSAKKGKAVVGSGSGSGFSKLLEGVVFVLSGFVNPERSKLRSQALEMGGEYQPDWNSDCTLLICAFSNTPKFRQVEADCGTIVSKEWISECYSQKKLVDIETFLMHAGKPWRKIKTSDVVDQDQESIPPGNLHKKVERKPSGFASKAAASTRVEYHFSPTEVKRWATDDLNKTIAWLESQDERPEPSEVMKIAAEGILTCLQDAIESLEQNQDIQRVTEQWNFIPCVVEELAKLEGVKSGKSFSRKDILQQAVTCKNIYEMEFNSSDDDSTVRKKKQKSSKESTDADHKSTDAAYDSDDTIEMTEEEIDLAYKTIASKVLK